MDILPQLLTNALITGSIYALASIGLAIAYGLLRIINFAHGHLMMLGAYLFFCFFEQWELPLWSACLLTFSSAILVSWITQVTFITPFQRYNHLLVFVTSLALSTILESLVSIIWGVNVRSFFIPMNSSFEIYGVFITPLQVGICIAAFVLLAILAFFFHFTPIGRITRVFAEFPHAAQALGYNRRVVEFLAYTLTVMLAFFAGIMVGLEINLQPVMGNSYTIKAFATMILGGLGNVWGTLIASYILGLIENLSIGLDFGGYSLPAGYKDAFAFCIILLILLFKPSGLFGKARRVL